jgi:hypothetical protein
MKVFQHVCRDGLQPPQETVAETHAWNSPIETTMDLSTSSKILLRVGVMAACSSRASQQKWGVDVTQTLPSRLISRRNSIQQRQRCG